MWLCVSIMPGITSRFRASTGRAAVPPICDATCAIVPSFTATSWAPSIPDAGSMTRPPRTIRSNFAIASLLLRNHTQRGRVDRGRHGLHSGKDLLREQPEALLRLGSGHPAVEKVDDHHLQAEGVLQRSDLLDDLVGSPDRLGGAACREARVGHTDVGGLTLEVFLVAGNACVARVVPLEIVMLRREELVSEVFPSFLGLRGGLRAVHPQKRGGLIRRQPHTRPDRVEPPHLRRHLVEARAGDEHLPKPVLGSHPRGGLGGERRLDARGEIAFVPRLWANGGRRNLVDLAVEGEALSSI